MAISGSNVYLVWQQWDGNNWDVFFARATDCGATFGSPVNLSNSSRAIGSGGVALAAEGPGVQVAWSEKVGGGGGTDEILYRGSTDGGASFGSVLNIANGAAANSVMPAISVSGAYVYLAWREAGIRFAASADGGATFTAPVDLSPGWADTRGIAGGPKLAASGTAVQVIWLSDSPGNYELFHRASTDGGASFNAERNLSISALDSSDAVVAADGADVYAVWRDALPSGEIFLVHSTDDGATFGAAVNVSNSAGDSGGPQLAIASPTEIYAIWSDRTPGNSDVFFARGMLP
jgi:hypothetical protein